MVYRLPFCAVLAMMLASFAGAPAPAAGTEPAPLYVIERDTLQTRNYVPIINHQTMVVNLGEAPVKLGLVSNIPAGKNRKGDGYPAFLEESLLAEPLFSPLEVAPRKTSYLAKPELAGTAGKPAYVWRNVPLQPGESVVAQYDNYFGEAGLYWRDDGFDFLGLGVKTDYRVEKPARDKTELSLSFEITNRTAEPVQDLGIGIFVPLRQLLKDREITMLELDRICSSPNAEASRLTKSDGFGEAAEGIGAGINIKELLPGKTEKFFLCLAGKAAPQSAASWPILTVTGRSIRPAVWPATTIKPDTPVNEARFSYLAYNLVVKDRQVFRFSPGDVGVEAAK